MCFEVLAAGLGAVGTGLDIAGAFGAKKAGKEAKKREQMATREKVRRIDRSREVTMSGARAQAGASGVRVESQSVLEYMADMASEFERERAFTKAAGASAAKLAERQGDATAMQYYGRALGSATDLLSFAYDRWSKPGNP